MKTIASILFVIMLFSAIPEARADLNIWVDTQEFSEKGDFIIYNNTPYNIVMANQGWTHADIFPPNYTLAPYSTAIDTDMYLRGSSSNGGTIAFSPFASPSVSGFKIRAYTEKSDKQTYWEMSLYPSSSAAKSVAKAAGSQLFPAPPSHELENVIQMVQGSLVYTLMASFNHDGSKDTYTGNTKLILTISEWTSTDLSQFQNNVGWER